MDSKMHLSSHCILGGMFVHLLPIRSLFTQLWSYPASCRAVKPPPFSPCWMPLPNLRQMTPENHGQKNAPKPSLYHKRHARSSSPCLQSLCKPVQLSRNPPCCEAPAIRRVGCGAQLLRKLNESRTVKCIKAVIVLTASGMFVQSHPICSICASLYSYPATCRDLKPPPF
jgi:hypothetical protein